MVQFLPAFVGIAILLVLIGAAGVKRLLKPKFKPSEEALAEARAMERPPTVSQSGHQMWIYERVPHKSQMRIRRTHRITGQREILSRDGKTYNPI